MSGAIRHVFTLDLVESRADVLLCVEGFVIDQALEAHSFVVALHY